MNKTGKIVVIAAPTGGGESTITQAVLKSFPSFRRLITATTRKPRNKEKNKIDYYFFNKAKFKREIKNGNILEHTYIKNRCAYYGSYKPDLENKLKNGFNLIINPDVVGAKFYKQHYRAVTIFIMPDSLKSIKQRLISRDKNIGAAELKKRLSNAKNEIKKESPFYDYLVINRQGELKQAIRRVKQIIRRSLDKY